MKILLALSISFMLLINSCSLLDDNSTVYTAANLYFKSIFGKPTLLSESDFSGMAIAQEAAEASGDAASNWSNYISIAGMGPEIFDAVVDALDPEKYVRITRDESTDGNGDYTAVVSIDAAKFLLEVFENRENVGRAMAKTSRMLELIGTEASQKDFKDTPMTLEKYYENIGCVFLGSIDDNRKVLSWLAAIDNEEESSCFLFYEEAGAESAEELASTIKENFGELETKVKLNYSIEDLGDGESYVTLIDSNEY